MCVSALIKAIYIISKSSNGSSRILQVYVSSNVSNCHDL